MYCKCGCELIGFLARIVLAIYLIVAFRVCSHDKPIYFFLYDQHIQLCPRKGKKLSHYSSYSTSAL